MSTLSKIRKPFMRNSMKWWSTYSWGQCPVKSIAHLDSCSRSRKRDLSKRYQDPPTFRRKGRPATNRLKASHEAGYRPRKNAKFRIGQVPLSQSADRLRSQSLNTHEPEPETGTLGRKQQKHGQVFTAARERSHLSPSPGPKARRCSNCGKPGHNIRGCKKAHELGLA